MATQVVWGTLAKISGGLSGTAPEFFVASTDQTNSVITTSGAISVQYGYGIFKVGDILWINYDQDGTPGQNVYTVTAAGGGSLEIYIEALGGALLAANNLSDVNNAATSRQNLGLEIGVNVQAYNAALASIAGLVTAADKMIYTTASNVYAVADLSAFARTLLDDAAAVNARATLGLVIGTDVQAYNANLAALAGLTGAADKLEYFTGAGAMALADLPAYGRTLIANTTNLLALDDLGFKRGDSDTWGGGGTSFAFTCAGIVATDVVFAQIIASANNVSVTKVVAGAGSITVDFSADPGAGTIVNFLGIPTV